MTRYFLTLFVIAGAVVSQGAFSQHLLNIDASGSHGIDGADGRVGSDSYSGPGGDASDANDGTDGRHSGDIVIDIEEGKAKRGVIVIRGTYDGKNLNKSVQFGNSGYIYLDASGGDGGEGGDGKRGGRGGDGTDGWDATQSSSGTDGTDGYDGGDGSDGGDGGNAGAGGDIVVKVPESDTHLMMLFNYDISAGRAGEGGAAGAGGRGGDGGRGGSSYSWTTQEYDGQSCTEHCTTSSNGNGSYSNSCSTSCVDTYRTEYHSNPGGSDGWDGSDGSSGSSGRRGSAASDGSYYVEVKDAAGRIKKYTTVFDLQLVSFKHVSAPKKIPQEVIEKFAKSIGKTVGSMTDEDHTKLFRSIDDGIYEPGESVRVYDIVVKNHNPAGEKVMPTPKNAEAMVYLNNNHWVLAEPQKLVIDKSIMPGATYQVPGHLDFTIADTKIQDRNTRFRSEGTIRPLSYLTKVNRKYKNFDNPRHFEITYPIEITPLFAPKLMAKGQEARIFWRVKNISKQSYGDDSLLGRAIRTSLRVRQDGMSDKYMEVSKKNDVEFASSFFQDITKLDAGESTLIEGKVRIRQDAPDYTKLEGEIDLGLEHVANPDQLKKIQFNDFDIRISRLYQRIKNVDILLVTNQGTEPQEIKEWDALAQKMGLKMAVWDLSYYGFLDLGRSIPNIGDLREDFRKKTIIILNNEFEKSLNEWIRPEAVLSKHDFFRALNESLTSLYLIGTSEQTLANFLTPVIGNKNNEYASVQDFHKDMSYHEDNDISYMGYKLQGDYVYDYDLVKSKGKDLRRVQKDAHSVSERLQKLYPHKNFMVLYNYGDHRSAAFTTSDLQPGDLLVKRIGGVGVGNAVSLEISDSAMKQGNFIHSAKNLLSLFLAMRFEQKLEYLERLITGEYADGEKSEDDINLIQGYSFLEGPPETQDAKYMMALTDAMLADLAHEHDIVLKQGKVIDDDFDYEYEIYNLRKLTRMRTRSSISGVPITEQTLLGQMLIRLGSGVRYVAETQSKPGVGWLLSDKRGYKFTSNILDRFEMVAMGQIAPPRLSQRQAGKVANPEQEGTWVWPEDICHSGVVSEEWYRRTCLVKGTDQLKHSGQNYDNWKMDRKNKRYSELSAAQRETYLGPGVSYEESPQQVETYERFRDQINFRTQLMIDEAKRNDGCRSLWCNFIRTKDKRAALASFMKDPGDEEGRAELDNVVPGQRVMPLKKAINLEQFEGRNKKLRWSYQKRREKEKEQVLDKGGE